MGLKQTSPPAVEPLSLAQAKRQVEVATGETHWDQLLEEDLIPAAREWVEEWTRRQLITATWQLTLDRFPDRPHLWLPRPPIQSVTSLQYYDTDGVEQTWAASNYLLAADGDDGRLATAPEISWPQTQQRLDAVTVSYVAGFGDAAADMPAGIRHALRLLVEHWFENRGPVVVGTVANSLQFSLESILWNYRLETLPNE